MKRERRECAPGERGVSGHCLEFAEIMVKSLAEYADWLFSDPRRLWPQPPEPEPVKALPSCAPLPGVRGIAWTLYGTLLSITDGRLLIAHPQEIRMQVALEKTIEEFNLWNSMYRKPGPPWQQLHAQYLRMIEDSRLAGSSVPGEENEVNLVTLWRMILESLKKDYTWDRQFYGTLEHYAEKVAFFFHACLQGVRAYPQALETLNALSATDLVQGLACNAQPFSMVHLGRALAAQGSPPPLARLLSRDCLSVSFRVGVKQPSTVLMQTCVRQFERMEILPEQVLFVGSRLQEEIAPAKKVGFWTALFAGDKRSLQATAADLQDPNLRPDRILTNLGQIRQILSVPKLSP